MNYQQEHGYYEINDRIYGKHPSKKKVYTIKAIETGAVYIGAKIFPKYEKPLLVGSNLVVWNMIYCDHKRGITLGVEW